MQRSIILLLVFIVLGGQCAFAASAKGIVISGNTDSVEILRDGRSEPCFPGVMLYEDDVLQGANIKNVVIEWYPYTSGVTIADDKIKIVYQPPSSMDLAISKLQEFMGFVDKEAVVQYAATRGGESVFSGPLPGTSATVLPGYKLSFAWDGNEGRKLVIANNKKDVVYSCDISGKSEIDIEQEVVGFKEGEEYTWRIEGLHDVYVLKIADRVLAKNIDDSLRQVEAMGGNKVQIIVGKAGCLQLMSEVYPTKVDLYWLSYNLLKNIDAGDDKNLAMRVKNLKARCIRHFENG